MAMNDSEKARIAGRKEAVKAGAAKGLSGKESRKRYYVQTRVAELEKAGKPVSAEKRKQLRQKFNSGDVSRKGFAAPKKKTKAIELVNTPVASKPSPATSRMKPVPGYKAGSRKPSSMSASSKKGRSGKGKVYDFARNELLGVDDFGRAGKNLRKGNYGKAAKSAGAGVLELGSSIATIFGVGAGVKAATGAAKAAKAAKLAKANRVGAIGKSPVRSLLVSGAKTGAKKSGAKVAPKVAKRVPRVAKTVSKPLTKKPTKSLTSKAVVRGGAKSGPRVVKKTRSSVKTTDFSNRGKPKISTTRVRSAPKPLAKKTAANAARKRAANAKYMTGTSK